MAFSRRLFDTRDARVGIASDGIAISGAGNTYSKRMRPSEVAQLGFQLWWTGTLAGTFTLWTSHKDSPIETTDADWVQDTTWTPTNPAGAAGQMESSIGNRRGWVRVKFAWTSGSGTLYGAESE